jgi:NAD dependent epimerase/dehydratase
MTWKARKVLVTGAGGFIGSHLTEALLKEGARVRALVHYNGRGHWGHLEHFSTRVPRGLEVVSGDIRDGFQVDSLVQGQDYVFHLGALIAIPFSYEAPQSFADTNILGTLNVLQACRRHRVRRLVHTSTSEVYGTARYVPIDEKHPLQGQSPYAATKIGADHLAESFHRSFDVPVTIVRPFNTYGPRQSARAVIPTILTALLSHAPALRLGDVRPVRDFTFVEDTVRGFLRAAERGPLGETTNIGSGRGWRIGDVVTLCAKTLGMKRPRLITDTRRVRPASSEVWRLICDNRRARRTLRWSPDVSLEEGLRRTATYLRGHLADYKPGVYNT